MTVTRGRAISYASIELEERSTLVRQNLWFFVAGVALTSEDSLLPWPTVD